MVSICALLVLSLLITGGGFTDSTGATLTSALSTGLLSLPVAIASLLLVSAPFGKPKAAAVSANTLSEVLVVAS